MAYDYVNAVQQDFKKSLQHAQQDGSLQFNTERQTWTYDGDEYADSIQVLEQMNINYTITGDSESPKTIFYTDAIEHINSSSAYDMFADYLEESGFNNATITSIVRNPSMIDTCIRQQVWNEHIADFDRQLHEAFNVTADMEQHATVSNTSYPAIQ